MGDVKEAHATDEVQVNICVPIITNNISETITLAKHIKI
jgi:hypothetical protein